MRAHYFTWFDEERTPEPEPWDVQSGGGPLANGEYFAAVFRHLEELLEARGPRVAADLSRLRVVATPNHGSLPMTGPDVVALLVLDNWSRTPRWSDDVGLVLATNRGRRWREAATMLPRPLGLLDVVDEARVRVERSLWARKGRRPAHARVVSVPLGYAHQVEQPLVPWEERDVDVFFAGSTSHAPGRGGPVRRAVRRSVGNVKTLHRERMMTAVEEVRRRRPDLAVAVDVVDGAAVAQRAGSYSEDLARSRFALDPRGTSRETYRYYECVRSGSVPVVTSLPRHGLYAGAPALRLRHWSDLPQALDHFRDHPEEARRLHEECLAWYRDVGSPEATARRLAPLVEATLRSSGGGPGA
ncbi:hypothetical protein [uncultured Pseudokineococcus sp.]|uniref:hypothetical protein n=1 Tax=uncultured Pseudokineococcus sp. TaxID=1642928 RepID=UPI002626A0AB|nr:hypothetical protein [uncultured Pseudokineococcus sp.]